MMIMKKITVAIIDDHKLIREMLTMLLSAKREIDVISQSGNYNEAIEVIKTQKPHIVLLDINLPDASGLDAVPFIQKSSPDSRIIAVSIHNQPAYAKKMLQLGAKAYITKNSSNYEIFKAIEEVMNDRVYVCEEIKDILFDKTFQVEMDQPSINDLSLREIEIIKFIRSGFSSREIAANLNISVRTVETHRQNIFKKLKLKNIQSLIKFINNTDLNFD